MPGRIPRVCLALALVGLCAPAANAQLVRFDDHRIVRVDVKTHEQLDAIADLGGTILNCVPAVGPMDVLIEEVRLGDFPPLGLDAQVIENDVQGAVERERASAEAVAGADPFADFFLSYHPYDGYGSIRWYLDELASRYPTLVSMVNVGSTLEGRVIWGIRVTAAGGASKPAVLVFGCEHAREWVACTHPAYVATHLVENYGLDPQATDLLDNVEFFFIPVFNVDGYVYSWTTDRFWRKNRRNGYGVDLNRNWAHGWGGAGSSGTTANETYRGTAPFSEPETQALRDFIISHPNIRAQLDVHNYGQLILWPWGYTIATCPDHAVYADVGTVMASLARSVHGATYTPGPVYTTIYPASGVSVDWTYAQRDIFSFSYEMRAGFTLPASYIVPNNEELLPATLHLSNSDWVRNPLQFQFPDGLPDTIFAGQETSIRVRIVEVFAALSPESVRFHYRFDPTDAFAEAPITPLGAGDYRAVLPSTNCFSTPEFYFSALTSVGTAVAQPPHVSDVITESNPPPCSTAPGDYNADGLVDTADQPHLETCYSGEDEPFGPNCRVFDFDADGDVDCDDVAAFAEAWTPSGPPPYFASCSRYTAPFAVPAGSRYITVTVTIPDVPVALSVASMSSDSCVMFVDFASDPTLAAAGIARIVDAPVYRLAGDWGTIRIADAHILPARRYEVRQHVGRLRSPAAPVVTAAWGDVDAPYGLVDALDISAAIHRFQGEEKAPPIERCDMHPAVPDYAIDVLDIAAIVDAYKARPYPFPTPLSCP